VALFEHLLVLFHNKVAPVKNPPVAISKTKPLPHHQCCFQSQITHIVPSVDANVCLVDANVCLVDAKHYLVDDKHCLVDDKHCLVDDTRLKPCITRLKPCITRLKLCIMTPPEIT